MDAGGRVHDEVGRTITLSMIYRMLRNPFYTGKFEYPVGSGNWYQGTYEPLVSQRLFEEAGKVLDMAPKKAWGTKEFAFTKMIICGACGSGITAEEKHKKLKDGEHQEIRVLPLLPCEGHQLQGRVDPGG